MESVANGGRQESSSCTALGEGATEVVTINDDDDIMACHLLTNQSLRKLCIIIMRLFCSVI
jgi:hypothetical protein